MLQAEAQLILIYGFSFVCLCDHGIVLFDLVVNFFLLDMLVFFVRCSCC